MPGIYHAPSTPLGHFKDKKGHFPKIFKIQKKRKEHSMDEKEKQRIARLYDEIFSTWPGSRQRKEITQGLSEADIDKVLERARRIEDGKKISKEGEQVLSFQEWKVLRRSCDNDSKKTMQSFELNFPRTSKEYEAQLERESQKIRDALTIPDREARWRKIAQIMKRL